MSKEDKALLDSVVDKIEYSFTRDILVKPLADEYVEKEIIKPVMTGVQDEDGNEINDTKTTKEKVLTTFAKGIVLAIPSGYEWADKNNHPEVGDIIAYSRKHSVDFDLFKDSKLVNPYNVVAFIKRA